MYNIITKKKEKTLHFKYNLIHRMNNPTKFQIKVDYIKYLAQNTEIHSQLCCFVLIQFDNMSIKLLKYHYYFVQFRVRFCFNLEIRF